MNIIPNLLALDAPHLTILLIGTILGLVTASIWMFCELERYVGRKRAPAAMARIDKGPDGRGRRDD